MRRPPSLKSFRQLVIAAVLVVGLCRGLGLQLGRKESVQPVDGELDQLRREMNFSTASMRASVLDS